MVESHLADWVAIADGDDVGELLDVSVVANDLGALLATSEAVSQDRDKLAAWFTGIGATVLLSVADTVIATGVGEPPTSTRVPVFKTSWSIGLGNTLSQAHAALAVAKAMGRGRIIDARDWEV